MKLVGVLKSLFGDGFVTLEQKENRYYELTDEAKGYVQNGSPEVQVLRIIHKNGGLQ